MAKTNNRLLSKRSILLSGKEKICEQPDVIAREHSDRGNPNPIECQEIIPDTTEDCEQVFDALREQKTKLQKKSNLSVQVKEASYLKIQDWAQEDRPRETPMLAKPTEK